MRQDLELREYAKSKGWKIKMSETDAALKREVWFKTLSKCPQDGLSFRRGYEMIWECTFFNKERSDRVYGWCHAVWNSAYTRLHGHTYNTDLKTLLDYEKI